MHCQEALCSSSHLLITTGGIFVISSSHLSMVEYHFNWHKMLRYVAGRLQLVSSAPSEQSWTLSQIWCNVIHLPSTHRNSPVGHGEVCECCIDTKTQKICLFITHVFFTARTVSVNSGQGPSHKYLVILNKNKSVVAMSIHNNCKNTHFKLWSMFGVILGPRYRSKSKNSWRRRL